MTAFNNFSLCNVKFKYIYKVYVYKVFVFQEAVPTSPVNLEDQAEVEGTESQGNLNSYSYYYFEEASISVSGKSLTLWR